MNEQLHRTDAKIRQQFAVLGEEDRILAKGHIYEQRNVMVTYRSGHVSEQYSTDAFDALLQSLNNVHKGGI